MDKKTPTKASLKLLATITVSARVRESNGTNPGLMETFAIVFPPSKADIFLMQTFTTRICTADYGNTKTKIIKEDRAKGDESSEKRKGRLGEQKKQRTCSLLRSFFQ